MGIIKTKITLENKDLKLFNEFELSDVEVFIEFETSDGKHYTDKALAEKHQKELDTYNDNSNSVKDVQISKDTIKQYFYQMKCAECPFGKECRDMEERVRRHTTSTFTLCSIITL
jgi:hypothetical protein